MTNGQSLYVLLVGINHWINTKLPPLDGCVNDSELMRSVFKDRFDVPDENIVTLTNEAATRAAITHHFRTHLIDRARQAATTDPRDQAPSFVFCFAGHGSRAKDQSQTQPDGLDETIVPHDSRTEGVFDIKDWELGSWLDELTTYTNNVTVILDCCHSGSGTRDTESTGTPRICPPDFRDQPTERPTLGIAAGTRSTAPATMGPQEKYTLLAACRNYEYAQEYTVRDGDEKRKHGVFTYFLAEEMMQLPTGSTPTCRELFERVRYRVSRKYRSQMPQCEGDRDRLLFGGVTAVRDPLMTVFDIKKRDKTLWIDGGMVHGLATGTRLTVYPPDTRTVDESTVSLGTMTVLNAEAVKSQCRADNGAKFECFSRVAVHESTNALPKRLVAIDVNDDDLQIRLQESLQAAELKPYVDVVIGADQSTDFVIGFVDDEEITIRDSSGKLLVQPVELNEFDLVASDIAALCRYHNVLDLKNRSRTSSLHGKIKVDLHEVVREDSDASPDVNEADDEAIRRIRSIQPIARTADGIPIVEFGIRIAIEVKNESDQPLFCEAISFGYDFAVQPLTGLIAAAGTHKRVEPGGTIWFGRDKSDRPIAFRPPNNPVERDQFTEAREFLKVVATADEADYEILRQNGLRIPIGQHRSAATSALSAVFAQAMSGSRALGADEDKSDEGDWATAELEYLVTRPTEEGAHRITAGSRVALPDYNLELEAPAGLNCVVRVLSHVQNVRSVNQGLQERPSGALWEQGLLTPLPLASRRSTAPSGTVIEIEADSDELTTVSTDQPLRLHLPDSADNDATVAIAWDGEFAFPVGATRKSGPIDIEWLPNSDARQHGAENVASGSRSLLRSVKLYLYRSANRTSSELGLHKVEFAADEIGSDIALSQRPIKKGEIAKGQRVAMVVAGFPSASLALVEQIHSVLRDRNPAYDHVLTFDYEGYGTPVPVNGKKMFQAMKGAGFFAADEVHVDVIAHGTGAMIARTMIELENGHRLVDRCYCVGGLNQGSPLLKLREAASFLGAFMMNSCYRGSFASAFVTFMLRRIARDGKGFADLSSNSQFLERLDNNGKRDKCEYHLLGGRFRVSENRQAILQRMWDGVRRSGQTLLDGIFGDDHDVVSNTAGTIKLTDNPDEAPPASATVIDCHHFEYFENQQALRELSARL